MARSRKKTSSAKASKGKKKKKTNKKAKSKTSLPNYPLPSFHFELSIGRSSSKSPDAAFQEVEGLTAEISFEEVHSGGENDKVYKLPQNVSYPNLILKRGMIKKNSSLVDWCTKCIHGEASFAIETKVITLSLLDTGNHKPLKSWSFYDAYPVKYEVSAFNAEENQLTIETIEIAYSKFAKV